MTDYDVVAHGAPRDDRTRCPECGAQLIVNDRGTYRYTCGDSAYWDEAGQVWTSKGWRTHEYLFGKRRRS